MRIELFRRETHELNNNTTLPVFDAATVHRSMTHRTIIQVDLINFIQLHWIINRFNSLLGDLSYYKVDEKARTIDLIKQTNGKGILIFTCDQVCI